MARGFAFACTAFVLDDVVFSHKPITPLPPGCACNVHGHSHRSRHRAAEYRNDAGYQHQRDRYHLIQIEDTLAPVPLDEVLAQLPVFAAVEPRR